MSVGDVFLRDFPHHHIITSETMCIYIDEYIYRVIIITSEVMCIYIDVYIYRTHHHISDDVYIYIITSVMMCIYIDVYIYRTHHHIRDDVNIHLIFEHIQPIADRVAQHPERVRDSFMCMIYK